MWNHDRRENLCETGVVGKDTGQRKQNFASWLLLEHLLFITRELQQDNVNAINPYHCYRVAQKKQTSHSHTHPCVPSHICMCEAIHTYACRAWCTNLHTDTHTHSHMQTYTQTHAGAPCRLTCLAAVA